MTILQHIRQLALLYQPAGRSPPWIGPHEHPVARQTDRIIAALTEGVSLRATARLVSVNRETVGKLALQIGKGCAELHDRRVVGVRVARIELDELWSFVGKSRSA